MIPLAYEIRLFCFEAIKWPVCTTIKFLNQVFRQGSSESEFVRMLAEIRLGQCSDQTNRVLIQLKKI